GHGSNVQGLETTATFIPETDEFEIHSPSMTASKWWAGGLGRTANHAIVVARLILKGEDFGTHNFIVQIRSMEDHKPLKGITIGDIGPKYGYETIDNGFMLFDHVRIPRSALLARFSQVSRDGTYTRPPSSKLSYSTMVFVRARIVADAGRSLARGVTITTRYSAVRRQFRDPVASASDPFFAEGQPKKGIETAVLDYPIQWRRIALQLSTAYALHFASVVVTEMYSDLVARLKKGDLSTLPEVHAATSGLKSLSTDMAAAGLEDLRRACGGHGYSEVSGFPQFIANFLPNVTYEGDNYLLTQQTTRYLLKTFRALKKTPSTKLASLSTSYLAAAAARTPDSPAPRWAVRLSTDLLNSSLVRAAFAHRAGRLVSELATDLDSGSQTWTDSLPDAHRVSRAHCQLLLVDAFAHALESPAAKKLDAGSRAVLARLGDLFALSTLEAEMGEFVADGFVSYQQAKMVRGAVRDALKELRPNAVALVDAWGFSDYLLDSALGRADGKVYETIFEWVSREPLNNGENYPVVKGYETLYKPLFNAKPALSKL
ncbi:acyl-CoA dehydrogenase/oxidase C-terminal, partial [Blyttiomyces helicus]